MYDVDIQISILQRKEIHRYKFKVIQTVNHYTTGTSVAVCYSLFEITAISHCKNLQKT